MINYRNKHYSGSMATNQHLEESGIKEHVLKFYLEPALVTDMEFAKMVLPKYVEDMNTILAKNTNRRLVFDPETGIILTETQPQTNSASLPLPLEGFEIWAHAVLSSYPYSYDGYGGLDASGAGVLAGLKWRKIYNPDEVSGAELKDYWIQVNNMLHELAHVYKAGIGEYYKLATIQDATGVSPSLNINLLDPDDSFWSDKLDFKPDPLLRNAVQEGILDRQALLDYVKYSELTAAIMNGDYRNGTPTVDLQNITVNVTNENGEPIADANVKIWSVIGRAPYNAELFLDSMTNLNGQISFAWGGASNPHNNYDFLRLIKVYKDGFIASAKYVSIYDADIEKLVKGNDLYDITMPLANTTIPTVSSITCGSPNPTVANSVDFVVTFSELVTGVDETDFIATKTGISDAVVNRVSGLGDTYTVNVFSGSSGDISLEVVDNDTIMGVDLNVLGGIGVDGLNFSDGETCTISFANRIFLPIIQH
ncbi:MAG: hypothetical protein JW908_08745 [Anaerolineales bacterium]|nr:hypothetical protein [Anaerolineales bacterium]